MPKHALLDTSLAVLLIVGATDPRLIARHKNLATYKYDTVDFDLLLELLSRFTELVFTPNVLTEASNLLRQIGEPAKSRLTAALGLTIKRSAERYVESRRGVQEPPFDRLGLTDATLLVAARQGLVLITADLALYLSAMDAGLEAVNYNHIRGSRRDF